MKPTRKYFTVTFVTHNNFMDEEHAIVYAHNEAEAKQEIEEALGDMLVAITVRRSTIREQLFAMRNHPYQIIIAI